MKKIITLSITTIALIAMFLDVFFLFFYTPAKTTTSATPTTPASARTVAATTTTYKDGTYLGTDGAMNTARFKFKSRSPTEKSRR